MMIETKQKKIYIVISQTGTFLSRVLRFFTGAEYNHVSLGLTENLHYMYSFGRKSPYNPIRGGMVLEAADYGTFKRFYNTEIVLLSLEVSDDKYQKCCDLIRDMAIKREKYHYNYFGLCLAPLRIAVKQKNRFYCSEFVKFVLTQLHIDGANELKNIVQPIHFIDFPDTQVVYRGKLKDYSSN